MIIRFVPFASSMESPFWVRYCREKLEKFQLSEQPISLQASYGVVDGPPRILCQESAFQRPAAGESPAAMGATANERVAVRYVGQEISGIGRSVLK